MSLLRVRAWSDSVPLHCQWALLEEGGQVQTGEGPLAALPRRARRIQLVIPAAQVLIAQAKVPPAARRGNGSVLAFAVEEQISSEPGANQVSWLGSISGGDALAVVDKLALARWRDALQGAGIGDCEVHCETLLIPLRSGEWSLAWNGHEGFVRSGDLEGAATDGGSRDAPPLCLELLLDNARTCNQVPRAIAIYTTGPALVPDLDAWSSRLGVTVRAAGPWDWRSALPGAGVNLNRQGRGWQGFSAKSARLRPAAWVLGAALAIHGVALLVDWARLAQERRTLSQRMEAKFRATFPEAASVVDPALQMRRKLVEARHAAGLSDSGDLLPMIEQVAIEAKALPAGTLRIMSYERGRMTLELFRLDPPAVRAMADRLRRSGLKVEYSGAARPDAAAVLVLRTS